LIGPYFDPLKQIILSKAHVAQIVDFGLQQVFPKPNVFTSILLLQRKTPSEESTRNTTEFVKVPDTQLFPQLIGCQALDRAALESLRWTPENSLVAQLLQSNSKLGELAWVKDVGLNHWSRGRGKTRGGSIATRVLYEGSVEHPLDKPYLKGRDVSRYSASFGNRWLRHDYRDRLDPTIDTMRYSPEFLEREKIVYRQTADRIIATLESKKLLTDKTLHTVVVRDEWQEELDLRYLLGLLNSHLMTHLYQAMAQEEGRTFAQVKIFRMRQLPIRTIDFSDLNDRARYDRMVGLVEQMLSLHKKLAVARIERERTVIGHQISATDRKIDRLVYELYGVTGKNIKIIEEKTNTLS
jgi:hypothetical protein